MTANTHHGATGVGRMPTHEIGTDAYRPTVLIVDDTPEHVTLLNRLLSPTYRTKVATSGARALEVARESPVPDLILLDVLMPGLDGYETCLRLKADPATAQIPVIFLTARAEVRDEQRGLEVGAIDYIAKPFSPPVVFARVRTHLSLKAATDRLLDQNHTLELEVAKRTRQATASEEAAIRALASLAETRDTETGNHIVRTQHYVRALARQLAEHPRYRADLTERVVRLLFKSAPLHDIGKVGIADQILLKPGKLTDEEYETMKTHTVLGARALERAESETGGGIEFLRYATEIARSHHEKWDGHGYPDQLTGTEIPLAARLMALADAYDAIRSKRVYKGAVSHEEAVQRILVDRGRHFDPDVVDAFLLVAEEFDAIATRFAER